MKNVIYVLFSAMFQTVVELMLVFALKNINKTLEVNFLVLIIELGYLARPGEGG